jgi:hypothetical protein
MKHTNTLCGRNVAREVEVGGKSACSNKCASRG